MCNSAVPLISLVLWTTKNENRGVVTEENLDIQGNQMEINFRGNSNLELPTKNDVQMNEMLQDFVLKTKQKVESDLGGAVVKDESSDFETILSVKKIKNSELILACFRSSHLEGILVTITF